MNKIKNISLPVFLSLVLIFIAIFQSCNKDSVVNTTTTTNLTNILGNWQVEEVQMVQAPIGPGISAEMKQNLVPFGLMNASLVGYCNVNFADSTWELYGNITNTPIKIICSAYDSVYTAGGYYEKDSTRITFVVDHYSKGVGSQTVGTSTYDLTDKLTINLNLANNEKWKIILEKL